MPPGWTTVTVPDETSELIDDIMAHEEADLKKYEVVDMAARIIAEDLGVLDEPEGPEVTVPESRREEFRNEATTLELNL